MGLFSSNLLLSEAYGKGDKPLNFNVEISHIHQRNTG